MKLKVVVNKQTEVCETEFYAVAFAVAQLMLDHGHKRVTVRYGNWHDVFTPMRRPEMKSYVKRWYRLRRV